MLCDGNEEGPFYKTVPLRVLHVNQVSLRMPRISRVPQWCSVFGQTNLGAVWPGSTPFETSSASFDRLLSGKIKSNCLNFMMITTIFSGVPIFLIFRWSLWFESENFPVPEINDNRLSVKGQIICHFIDLQAQNKYSCYKSRLTADRSHQRNDIPNSLHYIWQTGFCEQIWGIQKC